VRERGPPLTATEATPQTLSFVGLGASTSARYARDSSELLAEGFGRD
jgi:hypothetical protein